VEGDYAEDKANRYAHSGEHREHAGCGGARSVPTSGAEQEQDSPNRTHDEPDLTDAPGGAGR